MDVQDEKLANECLDLLNQINLQIKEVTIYAIARNIEPAKMQNMDGTFSLSILLHAKAMTMQALSFLKVSDE
jgi:abortive infection bacteriophage resistance protein